MKTTEFIDILKESLEIDDSEVLEDTDLKSLDNYDSLAILSIIALIDEHFGKKIKGEQFKNISTVKSLMTLIGMDNFDE